MSVGQLERTDLSTIFAPVRDEIEATSACMAKNLAQGHAYVQEMVVYLSSMQGKMFRPGLVLLAGHVAGNISEAHVTFAAAVEGIHTATLIHDDVLDEAQLRRGAASVHTRWGNETAVMLGDLVFARSINLMSHLPPFIFQEISSAVSLVCEGEIMQIRERMNPDIAEATYLNILSKKTASLCGSAAFVSARLSGLSISDAEVFRAFAVKVGLAFQIADDCLDVTGEATGKMPWNDLEKGKLTLPFIYLAEGMSPDRRAKFQEDFLCGKAFTDRDALQKMLQDEGAIGRCYELAGKFATQAQCLLESYKNNPCYGELMALADFAVSRSR